MDDHPFFLLKWPMGGLYPIFANPKADVGVT